jgi:3-deoxy-D-manno-octulosonic-acid transferase
MRIFYNIFIFFYHLAIQFATLFHSKARLFIRGRQNWFDNLEKACKDKKDIYVFHAASLGEFEQAKPLMEKLKNLKPEISIFLTFFSPSGYEVIKNKPVADYITYLPIDTAANARKFVATVHPIAVFFIKYEFWYNLMRELARKQIPFYYISAIFRPQQIFFKWYGKWFACQLKKASYFFVQNKTAENLLRNIGIHQVAITGDTRFDRVYNIAHTHPQLTIIEKFKENKKLLTVGSSWAEDEKLISQFYFNLKSDYKLLIAPHQIEEQRIKHIENSLKYVKTIRYSQIENSKIQDFDVLILDTIGLLNKVYQYAYVAYIGGAFKTGLHNTLEAAVYGIPIFFGTHYEKFDEAVKLVECGAAFSVKTSTEFLQIIRKFSIDSDYYETACKNARHFVSSNLGSSSKIISHLFPHLQI